MRSLGVWVVVVVVVAASAAWVRAAPPSDALAYAVFAIQRVDVGGKSRVQGDVGCLFGELSLGQGTRLTGAAAAPSIALRRHARAASGFFCASLTGGAAACAALPNPLVTTPAIVLVGPPSNVDVSVGKRSEATTPLSTGAYGALSAGTAAEMTLAGGAYQFESIDVGARARLVCLAACDITVRGRVNVGQAARLGAGDSIDPATVVVRIAAQGESTAFDAKSRAQIRGTVYAPSADVKVGSATRVTGALVGNTVSVGARARLQGPPGGA